MGYYIPGPTFEKAKFIIDTYQGTMINVPPKAYHEIPDGKALIVVVDNGRFEAAGFCYDGREFEAWIGDWRDGSDPRPMQFVLMDREKAEELSGFKQEAAK